MSTIKSEVNATIPASLGDPADAWIWAGDHLGAMRRRLYFATRAEGGLDEACRYHWQKPGSWFRARLALALCHSFRLDDTDALNLATACECFHNASLVHADLQDRDLRRRDQETVWHHFGSPMAIALGDHLLFSGYRVLGELAAHCGRAALVTTFSEGLGNAVRGQTPTCRLSPEAPMDTDALLHCYEQQARAKSGELLALPVVGALLLADAAPEVLDRARAIMRDYGLLYQCLCNLADTTASKAGRVPGSDLRNGELTAPMIWYLTVAPQAHGRALLAFLADPDPQTACYWMARLCNPPMLEHGTHYLQQCRARIRAGLAALPGDLNHLLSHGLEQALLG